MAKHTWVDNELITKELLNSMEDRIEAKAQKGDKGDNGIFTQKLESVTVAGEQPAQIKTALDSLIADLKAKGLMK